MNGQEFVRRARRYARRHGLDYYFDPAHGKGSHGTLYLGEHQTTVQHGEIPRRTFFAMLRQLRIEAKEF